MIFDEEFIGGKGLQGSCSQFRGRLAPWSDLLLVSRTDEFQEFKRAKAAANKTFSSPAVGGAAGKKGPTVLSPQHQFQQAGKPILQRPAGSSVGAGGKTSYAAAANAPATHLTRSVAEGKPLLQQTSNVGQKLLKALQKEDKEKMTLTASPSSKVAILKKKIGVPDKVEPSPAPIPPATPGVIPTSNGSGISVLAAAAGYTAADIGNEQTLLPSGPFQHPMMGVISYQAQQSMGLNMSSLTSAPALPTPPPPAAPAAADPTASAHPPAVSHSRAGTHSLQHKQPQHHQASPQRQRAPPSGAKLVLNKDATKRIVAHELKPNGAAHAPVTHAAPVPHPKPSAESDKPNSGAALLASLNKPKVKKAVAVDQHVSGSVSAEKHMVTVGEETAAETAPVPALTMAEKLANAKKLMKEKQQKMIQMKKAEYEHTTGEAEDTAAHASATAASVQETATSTKEAKIVKQKAKNTPTTASTEAPPSITAILTKAKLVASALACVGTTDATSDAVQTVAAATSASGSAAAAAAAPVSITALLKNAKRAPAVVDSAPALLTCPVDEKPAPSPPKLSISAVSPPAAQKKKAASALVPSKVLIAKK